MRVLVTGTGRGGTTLTREVVSGFGILRFHCGPRSNQEDTGFFSHKDLPENYMTKLATPNPPTPNPFTIENLVKRMEKHDDLLIIFSIRHPVDTCMSKIVRGQKHSDGGDKHWEKVSVDGTVEGSIRSVKLMQKIYRKIKSLYPERVMAMNFENLLLNRKDEIEKIAKFLDTKISKRSLAFFKHNSNPYQFRRYGTELDKSQVGLHKRWQIAFNGFFKDREKDINLIREAFKC